jgi:hypothetical protein
MVCRNVIVVPRMNMLLLLLVPPPQLHISLLLMPLPPLLLALLRLPVAALTSALKSVAMLLAAVVLRLHAPRRSNEFQNYGQWSSDNFCFAVVRYAFGLPTLRATEIDLFACGVALNVAKTRGTWTDVVAEYNSGVIASGLNGRQALVITEDVLNAEFCNILQQKKPPNALTSLIINSRSIMRDNSSSLLNVRCDAHARPCTPDHAVYYCAQQRTVSNVMLRVTSEAVVRPVRGMVNAGV